MMYRFLRHTACAVLGLLLLVSGSEALSAQTDFETETAFLARDGGRWIAENPATGPPFYGTEYTYIDDDSGAPSAMRYTVYGIRAAGDSIRYWDGMAGWDPIAGKVALRQFGSFSAPSQAMGTGLETRLNETTTEIPFELRYSAGGTRFVTDRMIVTGPDSFTSESFENGVMIATNDWTRVIETTAREPRPDVASSSLLHAAYPNPARGAVTLGFDLDRPGAVHLAILDVRGRRVRTLIDAEPRSSGTHAVVWDGTDEAGASAAPGVYLYRLEVEGRTETRAVVLFQ